jgi:cation diffusion facilitator family transporter
MHPPTPRHYADLKARAQQASALVVRGIALNAILALAKFAGGIFGQTYALVADGVESLLDIFSSAAAWAGFKVAGEPPDANHPYGHGKAESLAALVVAAVVFSAAGWIGWRSIQEILAPHEGPRWWTLPLLAVIVAVKVIFSNRLMLASNRTHSTALGVEAWHHFSDAVTSGAAFIGISVALLGGEGWEAADDWAALLACAVIAFNGAAISSRALGDVMDAAVPATFNNEIRQLALEVPGVRAIDKCRVRKSGLSHLVDIHVRVDGNLPVREGHAIAHRVKDALIASPSHAVTDVAVHIEPID